MRDLFDMPGLALQGDLPADGMAHGFDKNSDALDISHVNLAKYIEAADKTLDLAIADSAHARRPCTSAASRSLNNGGFVAHVVHERRRRAAEGQEARPRFPAGRRIHAYRRGRARAHGPVHH